MFDTDVKANLLRKRVSRLQLAPETMAKAESVLAETALSMAGAAEQLRKEWLNDLVASTDAGAFSHATRDPDNHFLAWLKDRARNPFHVSYRAVDSLAQRLGPEIAARVALVIWPQEIAWAQRFRVSENPVTATKAAMFLREAVGNPSRLFGKIADLYGDALIKSSYSDHIAHDYSPIDIRLEPDMPEFSPLFLTYAARSYSDLLLEMPREKIEALANRAHKDEMNDRGLIEAQNALEKIERFPMRRMQSVVSLSISLGLTPNSLFLAETGFLSLLKDGEISIVDDAVATFASLLSSDIDRERLIHLGDKPTIDAEEIQWGIAHLDKNWLSKLPSSQQKEGKSLLPYMEKWQFAIVEDQRETPYDPISDFCFFLSKEKNR